MNFVFHHVSLWKCLIHPLKYIPHQTRHRRICVWVHAPLLDQLQGNPWESETKSTSSPLGVNGMWECSDCLSIHSSSRLGNSSPPTAANESVCWPGLPPQWSVACIFHIHRKPGRLGRLMMQTRKLRTRQETWCKEFHQVSTAEWGVESHMSPDSVYGPVAKPPRELTPEMLTGLGCRGIVPSRLPSTGFHLQGGRAPPRRHGEPNTRVVYSNPSAQGIPLLEAGLSSSDKRMVGGQKELPVLGESWVLAGAAFAVYMNLEVLIWQDLWEI